VLKKKGSAACDGRAHKANFKVQPAQDSAVASQSQPEYQSPAARKSGGRRSRDKGNRAERALVRLLQDQDFAAERIPLSGAAGGSFASDLTVPVLGVDRVIEVKVRANGFRELYRWLEGRDVLIVKADRREPLAVVPLDLAAKIIRAAERARDGVGRDAL